MPGALRNQPFYLTRACPCVRHKVRNTAEGGSQRASPCASSASAVAHHESSPPTPALDCPYPWHLQG